MSLLDAPIPAHASALKLLRRSLRAGGAEARAILLNLMEEDRVSASGRATFHAALASTKGRRWSARYGEAAKTVERLLPLPSPRPVAIGGDWFTHVPLATLRKFGYLSPTLLAARPPRVLPLARPLGRTASGGSLSTWITDAIGSDPDEVRDRLGLWFVYKGAELYRVRFGVGAAPRRPLYIPTALDAGWYPAWRRPDARHADPWGMTRHLATDTPSSPELLALPHPADDRAAHHVGPVQTDPPRGFLAARGIP